MKLLPLLIVFTVLTALCAAEAMPTRNEVQNEIKQCKELPPGKQFNVGIQENEVQLSTYSDSKIESDCKIEAVLIAKLLMNKHKEVSRLVMCIYPYPGSFKFKQITVTRLEILAFSSGKVSDSELLSDMRIEEKSLNPPPPRSRPNKRARGNKYIRDFGQFRQR